MRYRLMATYRGAPYEAGIGPTDADVVLFAACPPPEELGFEPATGHWRKQLRIEEVQALWESRPMGTFRGDRCIVLDDLGDRLHIAYQGHDAYQAERLGYWQVDRGVYELITPRDEVSEIVEERFDYPHPATGPLPAVGRQTGPQPAVAAAHRAAAGRGTPDRATARRSARTPDRCPPWPADRATARRGSADRTAAGRRTPDRATARPSAAHRAAAGRGSADRATARRDGRPGPARRGAADPATARRDTAHRASANGGTADRSTARSATADWTTARPRTADRATARRPPVPHEPAVR